MHLQAIYSDRIIAQSQTAYIGRAYLLRWIAQLPPLRHGHQPRFYVPIYDHLRPLLERMRQERRGRASASALVFKIKDAKKALSAACKRLDLPPFSSATCGKA